MRARAAGRGSPARDPVLGCNKDVFVYHKNTPAKRRFVHRTAPLLRDVEVDATERNNYAPRVLGPNGRRTTAEITPFWCVLESPARRSRFVHVWWNSRIKEREAAREPRAAGVVGTENRDRAGNLFHETTKQTKERGSKMSDACSA